MAPIARRQLIASALATPVATAFTAAFGPASAQEGPFPNRPVRLVTGSAAGGAIDAITRLLADRLKTRWNQPVLVENRPGASQLIAADAVAKARPDGYTLLVATSTPMIQIKFVKKVIPFDARRDFKPLTVLGVGSIALVTAKASPYSTIPQLVEYARSVQKPLPYGTWGNGSGAHLIGEGLRSHTKIDLLHVPYNAETAELNDLLGGALAVTFLTQATAKAQADAGKVKVLAVSGPVRDPSLPDVPTFKEQGVPGLEVIGWAGVFSPSGVPQALIDQISAAMQRELKEPSVHEQFMRLGFAAAGNTPAQFSQLYDEDEARWTALAQIAGLKPE